MADWLAYGLEEAFADTPEIGVVRKNRPYSGLIRYEREGRPRMVERRARHHVAPRSRPSW